MNYIQKLYYNAIPSNLRYNFNISAAVMLLFGLFQGCYLNFYGLIVRQDYHVGPFWISLVIASFNFVGFLGLVVSSFAKKGKEHIYAKYIHIFSSIFLILCPFMKTGPWICIMLFIFHLATCYFPLENTVYGYVFPIEVRCKFLGYMKSCYGIAVMFVVLVAGSFIQVDVFGIPFWKYLFVLGGIFHIIRGFLFGLYKIPPLNFESSENPIGFIKKSFRLVKEEKINIPFIVSGLFYAVAVQGVSTLYPIFQVDILHFNGKILSVMTVISSICITVAYSFLGNLFNGTHPIKAWLWAIAFVVFTPFIFLFVNGFVWWILILEAFLHSFANAAGEIFWINSLIYLGGKEKIAEYQGLYTFIVGVRSFIAMFAVAFIINYCDKITQNHLINLKIAYSVLIGVIIICFVTCLPVLKMAKRRDRESKSV